MAESLGMDCKLYFNSTELTNCRNVDVTRDKAQTDVTKRGNDGIRAQRTTLKELAISWEMIYDPTDANFTAIQTAYNTNSEDTVRVEDDAGNTILEATGYVKACNVAQPMEDASTVSVEFTVSAVL